MFFSRKLYISAAFLPYFSFFVSLLLACTSSPALAKTHNDILLEYLMSSLCHPLSYHLQFSSVALLCLSLCDPIDCSMPNFPVLHRLLELAQTHAHWVSDAIQPSHPLLSPSPLAFNLSQHQCLFQWVSSLHHVAKVLKFQLQHQFFQWIFRTDFL